MSESTRSKIVDAAKWLFDQNGYHATGMRDIAKMATVSPRTVAQQFLGGKAEIYRAATGIPVISPEQGRDLLIALEAVSDAKATSSTIARAIALCQSIRSAA